MLFMDYEYDKDENDSSLKENELSQPINPHYNSLDIYDEWINLFNNYWLLFTKYMKKHKKTVNNNLNIRVIAGIKQNENNSKETVNICPNNKFFIQMDFLDQENLIVEGPYLEIDAENEIIFKYLLVQVANCVLSLVDKNNYNNGCYYVEYNNLLKFKRFLADLLYNYFYINVSQYNDYRFHLNNFDNYNTLFNYISETIEKIQTRRINGITNIDDLKFELEEQMTEDSLKTNEEIKRQLNNENNKYNKIYTILQK